MALKKKKQIQGESSPFGNMKLCCLFEDVQSRWGWLAGARVGASMERIVGVAWECPCLGQPRLSAGSVPARWPAALGAECEKQAGAEVE